MAKETTLLTDILEFVKRHEMPEWKFGKLAMNDQGLIPDLRAGRSPTMRSVTKIRVFMKKYR